MRVDDLVDSNGLQFTFEIWRPDTNIVNETTTLNDKITIIRGKYFPFLDIEMYWNANNKLRFKVHLKENQQLKYLNKGSCHTAMCFAAIPNGVFKRLYKLTSSSNKMLNSRVDEIYPEHTNALKIADLIPKEFPKMNKIKKMTEDSKTKKKEKEDLKKRKNSRQTYFCIGVCDVWKGENAIHITMNKLRKNIISSGSASLCRTINSPISANFFKDI